MKTTELDSIYDNLDKMSVNELLTYINAEDKKVAVIIEEIIPKITAAVEAAYQKVSNGGRLFYLGSGTSGRLGIVDASECPPTYGVEHGLVIGLIAGGDKAIRTAVEKAEDDFEEGWNDLLRHDISEKDFVIGLSASGTTPYVVGAIQRCSQNNILTAAITANKNSPLSKEAHFPIEAVVGPEFVTGSTRMKAGTAQKLILNMISTSLMVRLGKVKGNKMVDMQLNNEKLIDRGTRMIINATGMDYEKARKLLIEKGSVRKALEK